MPALPRVAKRNARAAGNAGEDVMALEPISHPVAGPAAFVRDLSAENAVNALVAFAFAITGPVAIVFAVAARGGLSEAQIASWIFGAFFINGLLSIAFSAAYRQPLAFFWTIPGTVLVGPALAHASFNEVVGAFLVTGLLMLMLGLTGVVRRVMDAVPLPIVMGMVAGVFLPFGLDWVKAFESDLAIALPMTATFLVISALPGLARRLPPLIVAMVVGLVAIALTRTGALPSISSGAVLAAPTLVVPQFNPATLIELVVPLAITVLVVQNGQGIAVLRTVGHAPPVNAIATACGLWSIFAGLVGAVSTCLTGPSNAILATGRHPARASRPRVRPVLAVLHDAPAGNAQGLHCHARRACHAARAAERLRHRLPGHIRDRCLGCLPGDGQRHGHCRHWRTVLGARVRHARLARPRARRLRSACGREELNIGRSTHIPHNP